MRGTALSYPTGVTLGDDVAGASTRNEHREVGRNAVYADLGDEH